MPVRRFVTSELPIRTLLPAKGAERFRRVRHAGKPVDQGGKIVRHRAIGAEARGMAKGQHIEEFLGNVWHAAWDCRDDLA